MSSLSLGVYCTCGAAWESTPVELSVFARMLIEFAKAHTGDGHRLCKKGTATKARRKAEALQ